MNVEPVLTVNKGTEESGEQSHRTIDLTDTELHERFQVKPLVHTKALATGTMDLWTD